MDLYDERDLKEKYKWRKEIFIDRISSHGFTRYKKRPAAGRHTPDFYIDESGMTLGVPAMSYLVIDYMSSAGM